MLRQLFRETLYSPTDDPKYNIQVIGTRSSETEKINLSLQINGVEKAWVTVENVGEEVVVKSFVNDNTTQLCLPL